MIKKFVKILELPGDRLEVCVSVYPSELQLNKVNTSDTKAAFLDLHLSISNDIVSTNLKLSISYF